MNKIVPEYIDNTAKNFLGQVMNQLDQDTKAFLASGELAFEDAFFYVKKNIKGMSGINDLVLPSDSEKVGVRNFDRAQLPTLQNLILQRVIIRYATHASETDPALRAFSSKVPGTAVPALQNGHIVIEQDDKPIITIPVAQALNPADFDTVSKEGIWLSNWRLIKAERKIAIKLHCAEGLSVATGAEHFIEVVLAGTKTRKR